MSATSPAARHPKLVAAAVLAATLAAGVLAGAAGDRLLAGRVRAAGDPCRGAEGGADLFAPLHLNDAQHRRVQAILERRRREMDLLWQDARPRMRALVDSTETEIRAVLTPEQRAEFDRLREEGRKLWIKRHPDRNRSPDSAGRAGVPDSTGRAGGASPGGRAGGEPR